MILRRIKLYSRSISTHALKIPQQTPRSYLFARNGRIQRLCKLGQVTDARKLFDEMSQRNVTSWNSMITGYTQNGRLDEAQALFNVCPDKNVRTWTALLTGYAKNGRIQEARAVFEAMPERNVVSWNAMISGYVQNGDLRCARMLFDAMTERDIASWNLIVIGYCHCGLMKEAREVFDQMGERNCGSYMVMISGYVEASEFGQAWDVFVTMIRTGMRPDQSIYVVTLSAIIALTYLEELENFRSYAIKTGYEGDVIVGTSILNAYTKIGCLDRAHAFFKTMPEKNGYSWTTMITALAQFGRLDDAVDMYEKAIEKTVHMRTTMITAYAHKGRILEARTIFDEISNPTVVTWNAMATGYAQNGMLEEAKDIFLRMPVRNTASWAAMIAGLVQNGQSNEALELFTELHRLGTVPSHSSFASALFACASIGAIEMGKQIHSLAIKTRCQYNSYVGSGLISMFAKCKYVEDVSHIFSTMKVRDPVSWNSLIVGQTENDMLADARNVFDRMPKRDVVSWNTIISAYVQVGHGDRALDLSIDMLSRGLNPNELTLTSLLGACGSLGATKLGEQFHGLIFKLGFDLYLLIGNTLLTMYFRFGSLVGLRIFEQMPEKDLVSWNAILGGCAQNGLGKEAVNIFEQMKAEGYVPDEISFLGVLCACAQAGLVDKGWAYFNSMSQNYRITPLLYHYTCMVDLLGRAGKLSEAEVLIQNMPVQADNVIWEVLLIACGVHRDTKLGQKVAAKIIQMGTVRSGTYVLLSNISISRYVG